jgi:hypothetical protein
MLMTKQLKNITENLLMLISRNGWRIFVLAFTILVTLPARAQQPTTVEMTPADFCQHPGVTCTQVPCAPILSTGTGKCTIAKVQGLRTPWYFIPPRELKHTFIATFTLKDPQRAGIAHLVALAATSADFGSTWYGLRADPRAIEVGWPLYGTRSAAKIAAVSFSITVASITISHVLLSHGKPHWWKDALAGVLDGTTIGGHVRGVWKNTR